MHVHVLAAPEPLDHARQPFLGHPADAGVQAGQVPVTLRPNQMSRKTDAITASRPTPPARMASVTSRLLSDALIADSSRRCRSRLQHGAEVRRPRPLPGPAFTGTGPLPALAMIWFSMAWNCW